MEIEWALVVSSLHMNFQVANVQRCKHACQSLYANCCIILLYFSRNCTRRLKIFYFLCLLYFSEKYYKPITVQYYTANCVSWVPRLTSLDLQTHARNRTHLCIGDLLYLLPQVRNTLYTAT